MLPFSQTGNAGTVLSHVVIPAGGRDRTRVQYVNATSDKAASLLTFKSLSKTTTVTAASAAAQTVRDMAITDIPFCQMNRDFLILKNFAPLVRENS